MNKRKKSKSKQEVPHYPLYYIFIMYYVLFKHNSRKIKETINSLDLFERKMIAAVDLFEDGWYIHVSLPFLGQQRIREPPLFCKTATTRIHHN